MTRLEFIQIIKDSENPFHNEFSHIYGSDYYSVNGVAIRIADHAKPVGSFGYETYKEGVNDFRNYEDALKYLSSKLDMTNKKDARAEFFNKKRPMLTIKENGDVVTPYGAVFACEESALNNWWRTKRDF